MNKLMVLDGNSIVNRAFYGVSSNLTTRTGQPTNAVFGFLNILNKLLDKHKKAYAKAIAKGIIQTYEKYHGEQANRAQANTKSK